MDLSKIKVFQMAGTNMKYLGQRQELLAQNIANANTPNYQAKDLKPLDFDKLLTTGNARSTSAFTLATTHKAHFPGAGDSAGMIGDEDESEPFEITPRGNKVVLEQEVMKASKNSMNYQMTTSIYRKMMQMMKTAIGEQ